VLRVNVDQPVTTLLNDTSVVRTITTTPATPELSFDFQFFRAIMRDGKASPITAAETYSSVHITPKHGHRVTTGSDGSAHFYV
jgi:hypothetical protein